MRFFTARSLGLATLVPALLLLVVVPGCAKQSEGERCGDDSAPDSSDCEDGLTCISIPPIAGNNRCCYTDGRGNDSRCNSSTTGSAGASAGGGNGVAGNAGASTGGEASVSGASGESGAGG